MLELHADKFTKPDKEFQPRINRRKSATSKLSTSGVYQPPSRTSSARGSIRDTSILKKNDTKNNSSEFLKGSRSQSPNKSINNQQEYENFDNEIEDEYDEDLTDRYKQKLNNSDANVMIENQNLQNKLNR